ncbi:uncharacterized protein LOC131996211 [Stomoxys calcitrans]|uniref:uncharacterized protein LOC131996211 n=1 Tax=Stomoxys calcitrans TaxID=35570 RepID=UPI0027E2852C|nr:uncharacterized protein LOC131996211 [Stomoxys calcitrans]
MLDRFSRWPEAVALKDMLATIKEPNSNLDYSKHLLIELDLNERGQQPIIPHSNGMTERWHRSFEAGLMCHSNTSWVEVLPTLIIGLITAFKEDLQASPADFLYGGHVRLAHEFFSQSNIPAESSEFLKKLCDHCNFLPIVPVSSHNKSKKFIFKNLKDCTHVFLCTDAVREPLEPPYGGPFEIV